MVCMAFVVQMFAQKAFYIYRNDGQMHGFFFNEVDSIVCSQLDVDSVYHSDYVTQEVWTPDSVFRIPLAAIESVGFVTPQTEYKADVIKLEGELRSYLEEVNENLLVFSASIPEYLIPNVGSKLVTLEMSDMIPVGFAGEVLSINKVNNTIVVECGSVDLLEVFERLYVTSEGSGEENLSNSLNIGFDKERMQPTVVLYDERHHLDYGNLSMNLTNELKAELKVRNVTYKPASLSLTYHPQFEVSGIVIVDRENGLYYKFNCIGDHQLTEKVSGSGQISCDKRAGINNLKGRLPICPFLEFYFEPGVFFKMASELSLDLTFTQHFKTALHHEWSSYGKVSGADSNRIVPVSSNVTGEAMFNGEITMGAYFDLGVCAFRTAGGLQKKANTLTGAKKETKWGSLKVGTELGWKAESHALLTRTDTENALTSTQCYERMQNNNISFSRYQSTALEFEPVPWASVSLPMPLEWTDPINSWTHVPTFSDVSLTVDPEASDQLLATALISGNCFTPVKVGFLLKDASGKEVDRFYFSSSYKNIAREYQHSFENVKINRRYTVYPIVQYGSIDMLASPKTGYNIPLWIKDVKQNASRIVDDKLRIYIKGELKTDESLNGDLSAYSDYGLAYEDPAGNGWYTFSKSQFNDDLTFNKFYVNIPYEYLVFDDTGMKATYECRFATYTKNEEGKATLYSPQTEILTYEIPLRITDLSQIKADYNDGNVKFSMKHELEIDEATIGNYTDYGLYYRNLTTNQVKRKSLLNNNVTTLTTSIEVPRDEFETDWSNYVATCNNYEFGTYAKDQDGNTSYYEPKQNSMVYDKRPAITTDTIFILSHEETDRKYYPTNSPYPTYCHIYYNTNVEIKTRINGVFWIDYVEWPDIVKNIKYIERDNEEATFTLTLLSYYHSSWNGERLLYGNTFLFYPNSNAYGNYSASLRPIYHLLNGKSWNPEQLGTNITYVGIIFDPPLVWTGDPVLNIGYYGKDEHRIVKFTY